MNMNSTTSHRPHLAILSIILIVSCLFLSACGKKEPKAKDLKAFFEHNWIADSGFEIKKLELSSYQTGPDVFDIKYSAIIENTVPLYTRSNVDTSKYIPLEQEYQKVLGVLKTLPVKFQPEFETNELTFNPIIYHLSSKVGTQGSFKGTANAELFVDTWNFELEDMADLDMEEQFQGGDKGSITKRGDNYFIKDSPELKDKMTKIEQKRSSFIAAVTEAEKLWKAEIMEIANNYENRLSNLKEGEKVCLMGDYQNGKLFVELFKEGSAFKMDFRNDGSKIDIVSYDVLSEKSENGYALKISNPRTSGGELFGPFLANAPNTGLLQLQSEKSFLVTQQNNSFKLNEISTSEFEEAIQATFVKQEVLVEMFSDNAYLNGYVSFPEKGFSEEVIIKIHSVESNGLFKGELESARNQFLKREISGRVALNKYAGSSTNTPIVINFPGNINKYDFNEASGEGGFVYNIFGQEYSKSFEIKSETLISSDRSWKWELGLASNERIEQIHASRDQRKQEILNAMEPGRRYEGTMSGIKNFLDVTTQKIGIKILKSENEGRSLEIEIYVPDYPRINRKFLGIVHFNDVKTNFTPIRLRTSGSQFEKNKFPENFKADIWLDKQFEINLKVENDKLVWGEHGELFLVSGAIESATSPTNNEVTNARSTSYKSNIRPIGNGVYGPSDKEGLLNTIQKTIAVTDSGANDMNKALAISDILGHFAGVTEPVSKEIYLQQAQALEKEAARNASIAFQLPEEPQTEGVYYLDNKSWKPVHITPYKLKQGFTDVLSGTGRLEMDYSEGVEEISISNPVFLFKQTTLEEFPCVAPISYKKEVPIMYLEKVVPGAAWIRKSIWSVVRLSKIENGWYVLEVLDPLKPGEYSICTGSNITAFKVTDKAIKNDYIKIQ